MTPLLGTFKFESALIGGWTFLADNSNSSVPGCMGVYRRIFYPLRDVVWLEHPAFQEELFKSPTFHNFADPFLQSILTSIFANFMYSLTLNKFYLLTYLLIKDIFAWVYLVSIEQITNRVSLEIIEIGYNSSEMYRDRYSGNYLFKVEAGNGEEEEEQIRILCGGGTPNSSLYEIP